MNEHEPCPFCGSEGKVEYYDGFFPCCNNPECPVYGDKPPYPNEEEAWEAWDSRPGEDKLRQEVEFAKIRIDELVTQMENWKNLCDNLIFVLRQ